MKILVVGSDKHQHVQCVDWHEITSKNVVDYHVVVINMATLQAEDIKKSYSTASRLRTSFARLLQSGGTIVVLGRTLETVEISNLTSTNNYLWCPINLTIPKESGTTIEIFPNYFHKYLTELKKVGLLLCGR